MPQKKCISEFKIPLRHLRRCYWPLRFKKRNTYLKNSVKCLLLLCFSKSQNKNLTVIKSHFTNDTGSLDLEKNHNNTDKNQRIYWKLFRCFTVRRPRVNDSLGNNKAVLKKICPVQLLKPQFRNDFSTASMVQILAYK